jgi:hypothetical protein
VTAVGSAENAAHEARRSTPVKAGARLGLAARGLVWVVLGLLAVQVALGDSAQADQGGALRAIADRPLGGALLVAVAVGFAAYALLQLLEAAVGHHGDDGARRTANRAVSGVQALVYLLLAGTTVRVLSGGGGDDPTQSLTGRAMSLPGGRLVVGAAAAVLVGVGLTLAVRGLKQDHDEDCDTLRLPRALRRPAVWIGVAGHLGRGLVLTLVGAFLLRAAWQFDPQEAKGLDAALQSLTGQSYGQGLLLVAAASLVAFGLWSFVESACKRL